MTAARVPLTHLLATSGVDALLIDLEHGQIDLASTHAMIAATNGTKATPLVRMPWMEPWQAKSVLDASAFGLAFPMVNTAEQARATVRAVRYPPLGERGLAPGYAATRWGLSTPEYLKVANNELLNIVTIEHPDAVTSLDSILAVPGIDVAVVAPFDLSASLGFPGQRDHPEVRRLSAEAEKKILAAGVLLAGVALSADEAKAKIELGYRFLVLAYDVPLLQAAAQRALEIVPH
jgi:4-hydroxy-2-oxoheptanedioate aldolase